MAPVIPLFKVFMAEDDSLVRETLHSGYLTQGPRVEEFEDALQHWMGLRPITVNSGTSAIHLALRLAGVGPGDEVITTPMTCVATNLPILALGAKPVWADVDPYTGLIDPRSVASRITVKTQAIVTVDWGGIPCDYDVLRTIADEHGIAVVEDAAHALGATYKGRKVGTLANYTCFSFQAIKHLTTGDGGALTCLSRDDDERARRLRWFGVDRTTKAEFRGEQNIEEWGYKFHMNDLNASVGLSNIVSLPEILKLHRKHGTALRSVSTGVLTYGDPSYDYESSDWLFTLILPNSDVRAKFKAHMENRGIQVSQVHWRNDKHDAFKAYTRQLPGLDLFADRMICVPVHWDVNINVVSRALMEFKA